MFIETHPMAFRSKEPTVFYGKNGQAVAGFVYQQEVLITADYGLRQYIQAYFHEMGHIMGQYLSFKYQTLSPDKCKETFIEVPENVKRNLNANLTSVPNSDTLDSAINLCNNILRVYTKGAFNPDSIKVNELSKDDLRDSWIGKSKNSGNGEVYYPNTRACRNAELDAMTVEAGCLTILENSVPFSEQFKIAPNSTAHIRAANIVSRAYKYPTTILESTFDLMDPLYL